MVLGVRRRRAPGFRAPVPRAAAFAALVPRAAAFAGLVALAAPAVTAAQDRDREAGIAPEAPPAAPPARSSAASSTARGSTAVGSAEQQVRRVFNLLVAAANRRDAGAESEFFWKSDRLVSVAQGTSTLGWDARHQNARQWYGALASQKIVPGEVETRAIGADAVALLATYGQEIEAKDGRRWEGEGVWSLVFRRIEGSWVVVWEHYSYERP